jgi:hypothetical protein
MHRLHTAASCSIRLARKARRARIGDIANEVAMIVLLVELEEQSTPNSTHFKKGKGLPESRDANIMLTKTTSVPNQRVFAEWQRRYAEFCTSFNSLTPGQLEQR